MRLFPQADHATERMSAVRRGLSIIAVAPWVGSNFRPPGWVDDLVVWGVVVPRFHPLVETGPAGSNDTVQVDAVMLKADRTTTWHMDVLNVPMAHSPFLPSSVLTQLQMTKIQSSASRCVCQANNSTIIYSADNT